MEGVVKGQVSVKKKVRKQGTRLVPVSATGEEGEGKRLRQFIRRDIRGRKNCPSAKEDEVVRLILENKCR